MFAGKRSKEDDEGLKSDPPNDGIQPSYVITVSCNYNFPKHNRIGPVPSELWN